MPNHAPWLQASHYCSIHPGPDEVTRRPCGCRADPVAFGHHCPEPAGSETAAAGDDTHSRPRSAGAPAPAQDREAGSTARDPAPRAAGAASSRGAQPLPPLPALLKAGDGDE